MTDHQAEYYKYKQKYLMLKNGEYGGAESKWKPGVKSTVSASDELDDLKFELIKFMKELKCCRRDIISLKIPQSHKNKYDFQQNLKSHYNSMYENIIKEIKDHDIEE